MIQHNNSLHLLTVCLISFFPQPATKPARQGLLMGMFLMLLNQSSGSMALITYASSIFELSNPPSATTVGVLPASISSIVLATIQLLGTIISLALVDRVGRKLLLIVSCLGMTIRYLTLAGYVHFLLPTGSSPSDNAVFDAVPSITSRLLPICSLSFSILLASIGLLTVPFIVMAEVLPSKVGSIFPSSTHLQQLSNTTRPEGRAI